MRKLRSKSGETLIETLMAILIISIALAFLATSVISAGKINAKVQNTDLNFAYDQATAVQDTLVVDGNLVPSVPVYGENGYYYYD